MSYPYAVVDDVFKRFPPISTMIGSGVNDVATVDIASVFIWDSQGIVDAYLGARYTLPLAAEPIVTAITADIATYRLVSERLPRIPDWMEKRYNNAISLLEQIRDGKMTLSTSSAPTTDGNTEVWASNEDYHPVFSPVLDALDQRADIDYIEAERAARLDDC